ncbi:MAG TPA: DNA repair protein RadA [Frankiaceae bacterium]|jgi:DNA repair protein RadA/Sms|nr:DNA repair protein RadA [Frankiaceae bacterium]
MAGRNLSSRYRCTECSAESLKWLGRCGSCQAWGTVEELAPRGVSVGLGGRSGSFARQTVTAALPITEVPSDMARSWPSGLSEFDRVLGGGLVPGAVVLLAGEPGVGKSTLLLAVAARAARSGRRVLVVTGEETAAQVQSRAARIDALADTLYLAAETDLGALVTHVEQVEPSLLIVDSVQTISVAEVDGVPGGVTQVREVSSALVSVAKSRGIATLLVGHVTKDGSVAGPRTLEHLVDVVLAVEGERSTPLRMVRAVKNRYGPTDEVGCFRLDGDGLADLPDPSGLFLSRAHGHPGTEHIAPPGTCVTVTLEGRRPLVAEVQALVAPPAGAHPRRAVAGLDPARLSMVLAVLETRLNVKLAINDVYASTVGGVRITEPAADLAVALAVMSVATRLPLPADLIALGEVGLAGDVRPCQGIERRLQAAARLGFRRAIVPAGYASPAVAVPDSMSVVCAADLEGVVAALRRFLAEHPRSGGQHGPGRSSAFDPEQLEAQVLALRPA